jgi:hypothetical protein
MVASNASRARPRQAASIGSPSTRDDIRIKAGLPTSPAATRESVRSRASSAQCTSSTMMSCGRRRAAAASRACRARVRPESRIASSIAR